MLWFNSANASIGFKFDFSLFGFWMFAEQYCDVPDDTGNGCICTIRNLFGEFFFGIFVSVEFDFDQFVRVERSIDGPNQILGHTIVSNDDYRIEVVRF